MLRIIVGVCVLLLVVRPVSAAAPVVCTTVEPGYTQNLTTLETPADVGFEETAVLEGFDVDLRQLVFGRMNMDYNVRVFGTYSEVGVRTRTAECDVGWSPFFATGSREACNEECPHLNGTFFGQDDPTVVRSPLPSALSSWSYWCCLDFSSNYINNQLGLMYEQPRKYQTFLERIAAHTPSFFNAVSMLFLSCVIAGHAIWMLEKEQNPQEFPPTYVHGIDDGIWWAMVTLTTVGYGDKSPKTPGGRIFSMAWMLTGIIICSMFTGWVTSIYLAINLETNVDNTIGSLSQLASGSRVCTYSSLASEVSLVPDLSIELSPSFSYCAKLLRKKQVEAIFMEIPIMSYSLFHTDEFGSARSTYVVSTPIVSRDTALMFPEVNQCLNETSSQATLRSQLNAALLAVSNENPRPNAYDAIVDKWFGLTYGEGVVEISDPESDDNDADGESWNYGTCITALVIMLGYLSLQLSWLIGPFVDAIKHAKVYSKELYRVDGDPSSSKVAASADGDGDGVVTRSEALVKVIKEVGAGVQKTVKVNFESGDSAQVPTLAGSNRDMNVAVQAMMTSNMKVGTQLETMHQLMMTMDARLRKLEGAPENIPVQSLHGSNLVVDFCDT